MAYSSESSPRRRDRSPSKSVSPAKGHIGLGSFSRVAGTYANASMLAPAPSTLSPDPGNASANDYFAAQYNNNTRVTPVVSPYSTLIQSRTSPSINPGAKNSFASSSAAASTAIANGREPSISISNGGRRKSSVQSTRTNATYGTSGSISTDSSRLSHLTGSPEHERKQRKRKGPSQKDMLSKALQRANDAVLMDNDSDLMGAVDAYQEACSLLKKVMMRSSVPEDRRKLDSIRSTYKDRIAELRGSMEISGDEFDEMAGPELHDVQRGYLQDDEADPLGDSHTDLYDAGPTDDAFGTSHFDPAVGMPPSPVRPHPRHQHPSYPGDDTTPDHEGLPAPSRNAWQQHTARTLPIVPLTLPRMPAADESVIPAPLSPWRTRSPANMEPRDRDLPQQQPSNLGSSGSSRQEKGHIRQDTAESTSWLDTIDESGDSTSSVHSRSSSMHENGARRYLVRRSGNTIADFDAALDSAIEAAYDDGLEPVTDADLVVYEDGRLEGVGQPIPPAIEGQYPSDIRRKVKAAKERVRQAEREDTYVKSKIELRSGRATPAGRITPAGRQTPGPDVNELYEQDELHEEDDILKEMEMEFSEDPPSLPLGPFPNDSDTSSSRNVWTNSGGSTEASATTNSSAHDIVKSIPSLPPTDSLPARPPSFTLPSLPALSSRKPSPVIPPPLASASSIASFAPAIVSPGVRERRLSGRKIGTLTIDTKAKLDASQQAPKTVAGSSARLSPIRQLEVDDGPKSAFETETSFAAQMDTFKGGLAAPQPQHEAGSEAASASPRTSLFARTPLSETKSAQQPSVPASPARSRPGTASGLRKNFSSSSLKSLKNMVATPTTADDSPQTPMTRMFSGSSQPGHGSVPDVPSLPTPAAASFLRHGLGPGSLSFFNVEIHSLASPGSPNPAIPNGPAPLEPCPESFLLRPFWLLRCFYQIIANPHGGYLSQKLFVPRDVWRVRNVKIRYVDEKVAQCDLLTAALLKLAKSDMDDADAVLEEMQSFELILDQVQGTLQKRLGAEVGLQGAAQLFKANAAGEDAGGATTTSSTPSRLSSWRRLGIRSKGSSGPSLPSAGASVGFGRDARDTLKLSSLPMATGVIVPKKHVRRDPTQILGIGQHANYMAALARLSDAAQILDQVARQVEDPGLRHSSQTHVGLELCTRHAADFFAFYICRFALNDIALMLDKFIKRGSDWIMS